MNPVVSRRAALVFSIPWAHAAQAAPLSTRQWLLGRWRSDAERSLSSRSVNGRLLTAEQRGAYSVIHGRLTYVFTPGQFTWVDDLVAGKTPETTPCRVVAETGSSIELQLLSPGQPAVGLVIYRESDDWLFVRNRSDLEYFRRQV